VRAGEADVRRRAGYANILYSLTLTRTRTRTLTRTRTRTRTLTLALTLTRYANILYNLGAYYGQFSAPLERAVAAERKPLEDKLQDFVKLAQWNDRTYVALRLSVEKSLL
jgi:midasin (ATPase involved in ribosome maturation)